MASKPREVYTPALLDTIERHIVDRWSQEFGVRSWKLTGGADPRFVGVGPDHETIAIDIRTVRYDRASEFRGWLTLSPGQARAVKADRPTGWAFFTLMVGLLPDDTPWWSALWDMDAVALHWEAVHEVVDLGERGRFYRVDPKDVPLDDRPEMFDFVQPDLGLFEAEAPIAPPDLIVRMAEWEDNIVKTPRQELLAVDAVMLRIRRMIRSEVERRDSANKTLSSV
jgi:hypothetical protein